MKTKLTLKLNKKSIEKAKKYARRNKVSLSGMVENYFNIISDKDKDFEINISPTVLDLSGIIQLPDDINIKNIYGRHIRDKYY